MYQNVVPLQTTDPSIARHPVTWIVVASARRARIFEACQHDQGVSLSRAGEVTAAACDASLAPRRTFDRAALASSGKSARGPSFGQEVAQMLMTNFRASRFDRLILVAPPQALGDLRGALDSTLRTRVQCEVCRDLSDVPCYELPSYLGSALKA